MPNGMTSEPPGGGVFADFVLQRELGRGGMGVVYLARQPKLGRSVALKVILPNYAADPLFRRRFEQEVAHAASLDHPNVVPVFEAGESDGHLFMAMRYVEGTDLRSLLALQGRLGPHDAARITSQIGEALDAAHAHGLIHRDVKPGNILLAGSDASAHVYLTDFGLTKDTASQSGLTHTDQWVGTVDYVAPEQLAGDRIDARSDVYGMACVLYQMLAGRLPFGGNDAQKMWAHMNTPLPSLSSTEPALGRAFDSVIQRGAAKNPLDRYPSAGDLARAAGAAANGQTATVPERSVARGVAAAGITVSEPTPGPTPGSGWVPAPSTDPAAGSSAPTQAQSRGSNRLLVGVAVFAAVAAGVAGGAALVSSLNDGGTSSKTVKTLNAGRAASGDEGRGGSERTVIRTPNGDSTTSFPVTYRPYSPSDPDPDYGYVATVPSGRGWSSPVETHPTDGELLRTSISGPDGTLLVIDRTPTEVPTLGGGYDDVRHVSQPSFGTATEYLFSNSQSIPECNGAPCVDFLIDDGTGGGWGVLGGGPSLSVAEQIASQVTQSIGYGE
jgi:serine/threonine-protein kinase